MPNEMNDYIIDHVLDDDFQQIVSFFGKVIHQEKNESKEMDYTICVDKDRHRATIYETEYGTIIYDRESGTLYLRGKESLKTCIEGILRRKVSTQEERHFPIKWSILLDNDAKVDNMVFKNTNIVIENITDDHKKRIFTETTFINCTIHGIARNILFDECTFKNCKIIAFRLDSSIFRNCEIIDNTQLFHSIITECVFEICGFSEDCLFNQCEIKKCNFEICNMYQCIFRKSRFLQTEFKNCTITQCLFKDQCKFNGSCKFNYCVLRNWELDNCEISAKFENCEGAIDFTECGYYEFDNFIKSPFTKCTDDIFENILKNSIIVKNIFSRQHFIGMLKQFIIILNTCEFKDCQKDTKKIEKYLMKLYKKYTKK